MREDPDEFKERLNLLPKDFNSLEGFLSKLMPFNARDVRFSSGMSVLELLLHHHDDGFTGVVVAVMEVTLRFMELNALWMW